MNEIIKLRKVHKYYLALVEGTPKKKSDTMTAYLFKDKVKNKVYVTDKKQDGAVKIITAYKTIKQVGQNTLVEVDLITGKTHQIRAHFAHIGNPLVGDGKYSKLDKNNVVWQTGELGRVDLGGGGTVAAYIANLNVDVVDVGVPVLSMHAPYEVVSKMDVYMTYKAFATFIN